MSIGYQGTSRHMLQPLTTFTVDRGLFLCCFVAPSSGTQAVEDCVREISFHPIGKDGHDRAVFS